MFLYLVYLALALLLFIAVRMYIKYAHNKTVLAHLPGYNQFLFPNLMKFVPSFLKPFIKSIPTEYFGDVVFWNLKERFNSHIVKFAMGGAPVVWVTDPDFPKLFIQLGPKVFVKQGFLVDFLNNRLGQNVFSAVDEEIWKRHRTLLNVAFTDKTYHYVCECTVEEMKQFDTIIKQNNKRDSGECMTAITMDVIGKTAFGYDFNNLVKIDNPDSIVNDTKQFFSQFISIAGLPQLLQRLPYGNIGKMNVTVEKILKLIGQVIESRKNTSADEKPRDILQLLLDSSEQADEKTKSANNQMTQYEMISNSFAVLIAGHDTTSHTLNFCMYLLATNQDVQLALQKQVDALLPNLQEPTYADLDNLRFVENVFKETLRIYPIAAVIPRGVKQDIDFKGTKIPAGSFVFTNTGAMQRDPDHWDEPMAFRPERWEEPKVIAKLKENPYLYAPFGIGHRSCIGKRFAQIEGIIVLTMILQRYTVRLADPLYKMVPVSAITTKAKDDLVIIFEQRNK